MAQNGGTGRKLDRIPLEVPTRARKGQAESVKAPREEPSEPRRALTREPLKVEERAGPIEEPIPTDKPERKRPTVAQVRDLERQLREKDEKTRSAGARVGELEELLEQRAQENAGLQTENARLSRDAKQLREENERLQEQVRTANGSIEGKDGRISELEVKERELNDEITRLKNQEETLNGRITALNQESQGNNERITGLEGEVTLKDGVIAGLRNDIQERDNRIQELQTALSTANSKVRIFGTSLKAGIAAVATIIVTTVLLWLAPLFPRNAVPSQTHNTSKSGAPTTSVLNPVAQLTMEKIEAAAKTNKDARAILKDIRRLTPQEQAEALTTVSRILLDIESQTGRTDWAEVRQQFNNP